MEARNWRLLTTALPSELQMSTASGAILDLHWHLMVERHLRLLRRIDTGELIGRYRDVVIGGSILPTIDATDTLIHLCVHGADSGGDRLLWLFDVHSAVCSEPPDWPEVVERAARYRVRGQVALMLRRSLRVFGTSVPGPVLDQLGQNGWSAVDVIAGVLAPIGAAYPRGSLGRSIARATREHPSHGARELLRRGAAWSWAGGPWGPDPSVLVPGSVNPGSALFDSGGSLEDYLEAVRVEGEFRGGPWYVVPNRASGD